MYCWNLNTNNLLDKHQVLSWFKQYLFFEIIKHCMLHYIVNKVSGLENKSYGLKTSSPEVLVCFLIIISNMEQFALIF